jgi:hypothetical protein
MRSVADDLRRELGERILTLSPGERIALTARLAELDLELFCSARRIPRGEGRRLLARARQAGRCPSHVAEGATA